MHRGCAPQIWDRLKPSEARLNTIQVVPFSNDRDSHALCSTRACLGCPAVARDVLCGMVAPAAPSTCAFDSHTLEARQRVPAAELGRYGMAIVRRGYLIRQRMDSAGSSTAVDVVGPGCCFPIDHATHEAGQPRVVIHAVTRALVCTCDETSVGAALERGGSTARELYVLEREASVRAERLAEARARGSSREKVAALLCVMADTLRPTHKDPRIPAELLQRDLASMLSIRHESVCRALRELTKRGLIARDEAGIVLTNRAKLENMRQR